MDTQPQEPTTDTQNSPPPDSIEADMQERDTLANELKQCEQSIENNFAKSCAESLNADDEELFFTDKEAFIKLVLQKQNEFLNSELTPKIKRLNELDNQIMEKKTFADIEQAQEAFLQENPEANINELMSFYNEDLSPRYKKELDALNPSDFFTALYELYKQSMGGGRQEEKEQGSEDLPQRLEGNPSEAQGGNNTSLMNRF